MRYSRSERVRNGNGHRHFSAGTPSITTRREGGYAVGPFGVWVTRGLEGARAGRRFDRTGSRFKTNLSRTDLSADTLLDDVGDGGEVFAAPAAVDGGVVG